LTNKPSTSARNPPFKKEDYEIVRYSANLRNIFISWVRF